jgi:hypothetical protein
MHHCQTGAHGGMIPPFHAVAILSTNSNTHNSSVVKSLYALNEKIVQTVLTWTPGKIAAFVKSRPVWSQIFILEIGPSKCR